MELEFFSDKNYVYVEGPDPPADTDVGKRILDIYESLESLTELPSQTYKGRIKFTFDKARKDRVLEVLSTIKYYDNTSPLTIRRGPAYALVTGNMHDTKVGAYLKSLPYRLVKYSALNSSGGFELSLDTADAFINWLTSNGYAWNGYKGEGVGMQGKR